MTWWSNRRNQLIVAQAVVVVVLCVAVYAALLRPSDMGSLTGVTAPGAYHGTHASDGPGGQHEVGGGNPRHGGALAGGPGSGGVLGAGGGPAAGSSPGGGGGAEAAAGGGGTPSGPTADQYDTAVTALAAKVGVPAATPP